MVSAQALFTCLAVSVAVVSEAFVMPQPPQIPMMQPFMPPMMSQVQPQFFDEQQPPYFGGQMPQQGMQYNGQEQMPPMFHGPMSMGPFQPPAFMMALENPMEVFGGFQPQGMGLGYLGGYDPTYQRPQKKYKKTTNNNSSNDSSSNDSDGTNQDSQ